MYGVAFKDNNKVDRCGVVSAGICDDDRLVCGCGLVSEVGLRIERTPTHALP